MKPEKRENRGVNKRTRYDDEEEDEDDDEEEEYNIENNNNNNNSNSNHHNNNHHNNNNNENNLVPMTNAPPKRMKIRFKIGNPNPVTLVYDEPPLQHTNINQNNNHLFVPSTSTLSTTETLSEGTLTPTIITTNREKLPKTKAISNNNHNVSKPSIDQKKKAPKRRDEEDGSEDFDEEEELDVANSDLDIMDDNLWEEESDSVIEENEIEDDLDLDEDSNLTPTSNASTSNSMNHNIHSNKKLTSRQLAMQNGGSEELFSLPLGFQSKKAAANVNISVEVAMRKRAENAAKRKHQAQIDRDEQKDMIIAQLLNRSTKKKEDERETKLLPVRYKPVQDSLRYVSNPSGNTLNIPASVLSMTMSVFTPQQPPLTATNPTTTKTPSETQITHPPFRKCQFCSNSKKYSSKSGIPVCSLECYKKIPQKEIVT